MGRFQVIIVLNSPVINIAVGFLCGIISGFGVGGGSLLMVWMTAVALIDQRTAQGINLLYFIPTAISALIFHIKQHMIYWKAVIPAVIFGCIASGISAWYATSIDTNVLRCFFGVFLLIIGTLELLKKKDRKRK